MVKIYLNLIEAGMWTLERVPEQWQKEVEEKLKELD